ncbi:hypothetical protein PUN28_002586 [Cardiocondyla obscurior]|uniref:Uncharacterized protein n=1 Tax=Cardiocondyla obscurior TaxID=286306 RepID=A0AAW2GV44_9HYME
MFFFSWHPLSQGVPPTRSSKYFPSSPAHYSSLVLCSCRSFSHRFLYYSHSFFLSLSFFSSQRPRCTGLQRAAAILHT